MATHRFYIPPPGWDLENLALSQEEAHHCLDVMRCSVGDRIIVFNGEGTEVEAEIVDTSKKHVQLKSLLVSQTDPPPARLTIGQAIPRGKNMDLIIQKATELGASRIIPLLSERTVVQLDAADLEKKRDKWQRVAIEACKQCGQNWLPTVETPLTVDQFVKKSGNAFRLIAAISPAARTLKEILADWDEENETRPADATLMVGPEGDFTPAEVSTAIGAGFSPLSLGPIILRSETAAIYALSVTGYELMN
ncbi:MAG: 16S rRNA (uracil(1498)-N(3))-methyltransferase [Verrucomicrobiales bacterium]|nr:16S rRNA (uracil(1498)-N(3))-methyltransferase [Verrucomicrobiales bacterium]